MKSWNFSPPSSHLFLFKFGPPLLSITSPLDFSISLSLLTPLHLASVPPPPFSFSSPLSLTQFTLIPFSISYIFPLYIPSRINSEQAARRRATVSPQTTQNSPQMNCSLCFSPGVHGFGLLMGLNMLLSNRKLYLLPVFFLLLLLFLLLRRPYHCC